MIKTISRFFSTLEGAQLCAFASVAVYAIIVIIFVEVISARLQKLKETEHEKAA